jgi:hypothetical protein
MTKPILQKRDRNLSVSVFKSIVTDNAGNKRDSYGCVLQRSYKKENDWVREQIHLFPDELLKLGAIGQRTYNALMDYVEQNKPVTNRTEQVIGSDYDDAPQDMGDGDSIPF